MRTSLLLIGFLAWAVLGCSDPAATGAGSASASQSAAPPVSASAPLPPVEKPPALDLDALRKGLKCAAPNAKKPEPGVRGPQDPCDILDEYSACKPGWSPITTTGDGRWLGAGQRVGEGKPVRELIMMRARRVGTNEVAVGQIGVKIGLAPLSDDPALQSTAEMALRALSAFDVPKPGNRAVDETKQRKEWPESFAQQAENNQVYVATDGGGYLCADADTQRLFLVRLDGNRDQPSAGLYATLYPVTW